MLRRLVGLCALVVAFAAAGGRPASAGPPQRVVSVNITSDEILLALAPDRLVAVSVLADDPEVSSVVREARAIPVRVNADPERILALGPDLVVIGGHHLHVAAQLESLGLRVIRIQGFESIEWIEGLIRTLGGEVGARDAAALLIASMESRLASIRARVAGLPRPRVLTYSMGGSTAGAGTTSDDVIRAAGGENVAAAVGISGWKRLSLEQLVTADPEVILTSASTRWSPAPLSELLSHPALRAVRARREGRIYQLPGRLMITSSHHIVETVESLARLLHPPAAAPASR